MRRSLSPADVAGDAAEAVAAASTAPGSIATLILPADVSWEDGAEVGRPACRCGPRRTWRRPWSRRSPRCCALGEPTVLFLGGDVMDADGQLAAAQVAAGTGARLMAETFPARTARGAGLPDVARLPYPPEMAIAALAGTKHLVLAGASRPVHFFGYPGRARPPGARGLHGARAQRAGGGRRRRARRRWREVAAPDADARGAGGVAAGAAHRRADPAGDGGRRRRAAAGGRDRRRRGADLRGAG